MGFKEYYNFKKLSNHCAIAMYVEFDIKVLVNCATIVEKYSAVKLQDYPDCYREFYITTSLMHLEIMFVCCPSKLRSNVPVASKFDPLANVASRSDILVQGGVWWKGMFMVHRTLLKGSRAACTKVSDTLQDSRSDRVWKYTWPKKILRVWQNINKFHRLTNVFITYK